MSKSRAPQANWIIEAWEIYDAIEKLPLMPDNLFNLFKLPELPPPMIDALEKLQDKLKAYLAYRMSHQLARVPPGKGFEWSFPSRDFAVTAEHETYLTTVVGMDFSGTDRFALEAHMTVGADPILTHPADPILTRGWKPTA